MTNILGINPAHDATVALLKEGVIVNAVAEERLSRIKSHLGFPYRAVQKVLEISHTKPEEIDLVVFPFQDYFKASPYFTRFILNPEGGNIDFANELPFRARWAMFRRELDEWHYGPEKLRNQYVSQTPQKYREVLNALGLMCPYKIVDHHMAHSASAYFTSGIDRCLVFTSDGSGDGVSATLGIGSKGQIDRIFWTPAADSAGAFYAAVTKFLGFKRHRHEGKVTWLAAYGNPEFAYGAMEKCLSLSSDMESFCVPLRNGRDSVGKGLSQCFMTLRHNHLWGAHTNTFLTHFERALSGLSASNIASAAQKRLEDCFVRFLSNAIRKWGEIPVVMAGGTFANVRLNQMLMKCDGVKEVFIHPNMGDGGAALGAALFEWSNTLISRGKKLTPSRLPHVFFGPSYSAIDIEKVIRRSPFRWEYCENIEKQVAQLVAEGKIVARFDGPMEYGPRALGNRSILVSPKDPKVNDWLNKKLKRTEFMPFAPAVIQEEAHHYFRGVFQASYPCSFMTMTLEATELCKREAPAVVHVDGTARPQFVTSEANRSFYRILKEYQKISGLPLMINTSFNIHEEPIVCTPQDALRCFQKGHLDYLAMGPFLIHSNGI